MVVAAAGAVIARVNGTSWEQLISTKIFVPLNMKQSFFSFEEAERNGEFSKDYYNGRIDSVLKEYTVDVHCGC